MKFVTGSTEKQVMEISDVLAQLDSLAGKEIRMNGAIHTIRDMGDVAFVVLRKREGLVQTVFETGEVKEKELKDLKEAATVEVSGVVALEDRAPNGFQQMEIKHITRDKIKSSSDFTSKCQRAGKIQDSGRNR